MTSSLRSLDWPWTPERTKKMYVVFYRPNPQVLSTRRERERVSKFVPSTMSARWRRTLPCPLSTPPRRCTPSPTWNSVITRHRALAAVRIYRVTRILYRTKLPRLGVPPSCPRSLPTYALMSKAERYWSHQLSMPWKFNRLWSHHLPIKSQTFYATQNPLSDEGTCAAHTSYSCAFHCSSQPTKRLHTFCCPE